MKPQKLDIKYLIKMNLRAHVYTLIWLLDVEEILRLHFSPLYYFLWWRAIIFLFINKLQ